VAAVNRDVRTFVGRVRELEHLRGLAAAAAHAPAAAVVVAEPGLGKTRLLTELTAELTTPVIELRGYEAAREVPLASAAGLLRTLSSAPKSGERLDAILLGEIGASLALEKIRLFETAYRCLAELAPRAIVVDDLQWIDPETVSLLRYLLGAAQATRLPLLFLGAARPAGAAAAAALLPDSEQLRLGPLRPEEAAALIAGAAPELGADEADRLCRLAQGSPFWLQALACGDRRTTGPGEHLRHRITGLDPDAGRVFALLVVADEPLTVTAVGELLAWKDERAQRAIARLANRALVLEEAEWVRIAHDLIRETARAQLPELEQTMLHGVLAGWLESRSGGDVRGLFGALEHRRAAGLESVELAMRIALSPQRRLLGTNGLRTLGEIADAATGPAGEQLQLEVAALATDLGAWQTSFERWSALTNRLPTAPARTRAALAAAASAFRLGRPDAVHVFARRAREGHVDAASPIEADVHEAEALLWLENRPADAEPFVRRAAAAADSLVAAAGGIEALAGPDRDAYARARRAQLDAAIRQADAATVARCADQIQATAHDPVEVLTAASDGIFSLLQFEGLPSAAEPHAQRLLEQSRRVVLPSVEVEATHWVGWIAQHRGRLDEAATQLERTLELARRVGPPRRFRLPQLQAIAHSIEASRGDWRTHVAAIESAISSEPDAHFRLIVRHLHIWLLGRFGSPDEHELDRLLRPLAEDAHLAGCDRCYWESVLHAAEAQARTGAVVPARDALEEWQAAHPSPRPGPGARSRYVHALLTMHRDPEASLPLFGESASLATELGYTLMRLWIDLDAAAALALVDRSRAIDALRAAARTAEAIGARSEQSLAVQHLRALGVRTWRRHSDSGLLTAREQEIARFVAAGDSNPEIAAALFLSRKTVERHVSNILRKVGARNRTELATRLRRSTTDTGAAR
jgi:DNA-binding CsgD family transcriptional regulator